MSSGQRAVSVARPPVRRTARVAAHGKRVAGRRQAHDSETRAAGFRFAVGRLPFGLGQQRALAPVGALLERLFLGRHIVIHPVIQRVEGYQQAAEGQVADGSHAIRLGRRSIVVSLLGGRGAGACQFCC